MIINIQKLSEEISGVKPEIKTDKEFVFGFQRPDTILAPAKFSTTGAIEIISGVVHESFHMKRMLEGIEYYKTIPSKNPMVFIIKEEYEVKLLTDKWIEENIHRFDGENLLLRAQIWNNLYFGSYLFEFCVLMDDDAPLAWRELSNYVRISEDEFNTCLLTTLGFQNPKVKLVNLRDIISWVKEKAVLLKGE